MLVPQLTERLRDAENESMAKIAELEKQLSQARKESETLRVRLRGSGLGGNKGWPGLPRTDHLGLLGLTRPSTPGREWGLRARLARGSQPLPRGSQERFSESTPMGTSRRSSEPEKVAAPAPARPSALELKVEELQEKGLIRILRGPGDAVSIEILPVAVATPSGSDAPTPGAPTGSPSSGVQSSRLAGEAGRNGGGVQGEPGDVSGRRGGRGRFWLRAWLRCRGAAIGPVRMRRAGRRN